MLKVMLSYRFGYNVPGVPLLCIIEVTSESFAVAVSQFSDIVSFVY